MDTIGTPERARGSRNVLSCARWLSQWRPWDPLGSRGTFKSRPWGAQGRPWDPFPPVSVLQERSLDAFKVLLSSDPCK